MSEGVTETIERTCRHARRGAGTDAERRTAGELARRLGESGFEAELQPTWVHPLWPLSAALHCTLGVAGSLLAGEAPAVGFAVILVAATSLYLDLSSRWYLLRRLAFRRASQNVVALPESATDPEDDQSVIVLCASYDAPRTGAIFNRLPARLLAALRRVLRVASPTGILFWSMALLLPPLGARMAGLDANWLALAQLPQTLILTAGAFYYGEIALSPLSPGANVNASAVASAIRAAERIRDAGVETPVGVVLAGAGGVGDQGMRSFIRSNRKRLDRDRTWFIGFEATGVGEPRYARAAGGPLTTPADPELLALAEALAGEDGELGELSLAPGSAASVAGRYGFSYLALCAREGSDYLPPVGRSPADIASACDPETVEAVAEAGANLAILLDRRLSRQR